MSADAFDEYITYIHEAGIIDTPDPINAMYQRMFADKFCERYREGEHDISPRSSPNAFNQHTNGGRSNGLQIKTKRWNIKQKTSIRNPQPQGIKIVTNAQKYSNTILTN